MKNPNNPPEREFTIHEVYYDQNGDIYGWIAAESAPTGTEQLGSLRKEIDMLREALDRPILTQKEGTERLIEWNG